MPGVTIVYDGDFTVAEPTGPPRFSAPFEGDPEPYLLEQDYTQAYEYWVRLPLNVANSTYGGYYLIGESPHQPIGNGIIKWTRLYAKVPAARSDYESFSAQLPGLTNGAANSFKLIANHQGTNVTVGGAALTQFQTTTAHGFIVGDVVAIAFNLSIFDVQEQNTFVLRSVVSTASATEFKVAVIFPTNPPYYTYAAKSSMGRSPFTKVVRSRLDRVYYLPGITPGIATVADIPILDPGLITDQFGQITNTYNSLTTPDQNTYLADVLAKTWVVIEASILRRWKGNILEKTTRYIVAE